MKPAGTVERFFINTSVPYTALSVATSLYASLLITLRIVLIQHEMSVFETGVAISKSYSKVKEIVIESCALYSASLLAYIILTAKKDPNLSYPENIHPQIAVSCSFFPLDSHV